MARESKTKFAILGMLNQGPKCGYEIKKELEKSATFFWNESYGQIYPMLKRMVREELATIEVIAREDQPDMKIYTISDKGTEELGRWLKLPADPHPVRNESMLKIYFGANTTPGMVKTHITRYRDRMSQQLRDIEDQQEQLDESAEEALFKKLSLRYGELLSEAIQTWCDEAEKEISKL